MNIKYLIIIGVIIIIAIFFIVIKNKDNDKSSKELELTYEINAGIPFKWVYEIEDENIVEFVKSYVVRDDNKGGIVGASVYTNYVFKGLKKGKTVITFRCIPIADDVGGDILEKKHYIEVDDDLNISLINNNE